MFDTPEFQALRREYLQGALERVAHMRTAAAMLRSGGEVDLAELRSEVHKFRGSGGFYGFKALSETSAAAEDYIVMIRDGDAVRDDDKLATLIEAVIAEAEQAAKQVGL